MISSSSLELCLSWEELVTWAGRGVVAERVSQAS